MWWGESNENLVSAQSRWRRRRINKLLSALWNAEWKLVAQKQGSPKVSFMLTRNFHFIVDQLKYNDFDFATNRLFSTLLLLLLLFLVIKRYDKTSLKLHISSSWPLMSCFSLVVWFKVKEEPSEFSQSELNSLEHRSCNCFSSFSRLVVTNRIERWLYKAPNSELLTSVRTLRVGRKVSAKDSSI